MAARDWRKKIQVAKNVDVLMIVIPMKDGGLALNHARLRHPQDGFFGNVLYWKDNTTHIAQDSFHPSPF